MDRMNGICMGCMSPLGMGETICNRCSYDNTIPNPLGTLPAGSILEGGYMVGKVIRRSDLTITYLGLHTGKNVKVYIEEFYPAPLVSRDWDRCAVNVPEENRIRYKTLYSDIADRWKRLSRLDSRSVVKIKELLNGYGTIYSVTAYLPYHTLEMQLEDKGVYSWPEAKAAFLPLFTMLSNLHNQGLVHCGISPDNVLVNRRGELILIGFALPELRTEGSGLTPELYAGYSAPEQYSKNLWQGEWTDVYSLGAVLYRTLTGNDPISAPDRLKRDNLPEAASIVPSIPDNVSEALVRALAPEKQERFLSLDEFTAALLKETDSNTAVFRPEPVNQKLNPPAKSSPAINKRFLLSAALVISISINILLGITMITSSPPSPPPPASSESMVVPKLMTQRFVGVYIKMIQDNPTLYGGYSFMTEYAYNEDYPAGIVFDQSVKLGEPVPEGRSVTLYVSRGSQYLVMPYLIGSSVNFASKALTDLNINFEFAYDYNPDSSGIAGTVTNCSKGPGARIARETEKVTLTIKQPVATLKNERTGSE